MADLFSRFPAASPAQLWVTLMGWASTEAGPEPKIHPILVGLTESHDLRKGWLAWRSAVHL